MFDPSLLNGAAATFLALIRLMLFLVWRKVNALLQSNAEQIKVELILPLNSI